MLWRIISTLSLLTILLTSPISSVLAMGAPSIKQNIFIHYEKGKRVGGAEQNPARLRDHRDFIGGGVKWVDLPVKLEVNPDYSGLTSASVLYAIGISAEEWDDGDYGGWRGVPPNLFDDTIDLTTKTYDDLAWTSNKRDGYNTLVWGDYPPRGVIAVAIVWWNLRTNNIVEFDMVFDTDYTWSDSGEPGKMDLQNIAAHELGHGIGLADLYDPGTSKETMYGYSSLGETVKRDLFWGDKIGVTILYR